MNQYETVVGGRRDQAFPALNEADISRLERFDERPHYRRGARLFAAGTDARHAPGRTIG